MERVHVCACTMEVWFEFFPTLGKFTTTSPVRSAIINDDIIIFNNKPSGTLKYGKNGLEVVQSLRVWTCSCLSVHFIDFLLFILVAQRFQFVKTIPSHHSLMTLSDVMAYIQILWDFACNVYEAAVKIKKDIVEVKKDIQVLQKDNARSKLDIIRLNSRDDVKIH